VLDTSLGPRPLPSSWPNGPLAYVEWYSILSSAAHTHHGNMYFVKKVTANRQTHISGAIVSLSNIRQSCMLFPLFPENDVPQDWNSANVLDLCSTFLVNNWSSKYAYQTIW
jgi:hypothetical protein